MRMRESWVAGVAGLTMALTVGTAMAADSVAAGPVEAQHDQGAVNTAPAAGSAMQELIETLHANGTIDEAAYQRLKAVAAADAGSRRQPPPAVAKAEPAKAAPPANSVSTKGGLLKFSSADGSDQFQIGGRIEVNGAFYDADQRELGNGTQLRRARLFMAGKLNDIWGFKSEFDFAGGSVGITDVYIQNTLFPWTVTLGHFKEYYSLEQQTSEKYITFMERSLPGAFFPGRNLGLGLTNGGDTWSAAFGVFGEGFKSNDDTAGKEQDAGYGATGRVTWAPFGQGDHMLHLGASASYRKLNDSHTLRYRSRPESNITNVRLVDTGVIDDSDSRMLYGLEAAGVVGPWSAQGEYFLANVDRRDGGNVNFQGWYVQTAYVLTGESRNYSASSGKFERFTPSRPVSDGGPGAWQLAARLSEVDLNDGAITGGKERNLTLGVNWFLEPTLRLSLNYVNVLEVDGGPNAGDKPSSYEARAYIEF
jgi:phosphate-selective porin OprO/OprP